MQRTNSQMMNQETLSKALLVCYIDRCLNLPVRIKNLQSFFKFRKFSDREKVVENQIHFVELKLIQQKTKLKHLKVKQIPNLNIYHKSYVQIHFNKNYLFKYVIHVVIMISLLFLKYQLNKYTILRQWRLICKHFHSKVHMNH
jgi:hypothetical protein